MTERLYLEDAYRTEAPGIVVDADPTGIVLDAAVFYPRAGGQPGDAGTIRWDGGAVTVTEARKGDGERVLLVPTPEAALPPAGTPVTASIDWTLRLRHMRMHTALHLLCSLIPGAAVTGGQIGADKSRLDFDLPNPPSREEIQAGLDALIAADHPVTTSWVDESLLDARPDLVRTLSVKPPRGTGRLRLVRIGPEDSPVDLQPCGGTHVKSTAEIGPLRVIKIENKGRQNRRISLAWPEHVA